MDNKQVYFQPEFKVHETLITPKGVELLSYYVYANYNNARNDFSNLKILAYIGDDIEEPYFVDGDGNEEEYQKPKRFSFSEKVPEEGAYICLCWKDGSECESVYNGLDKNILPLPTHWFYVDNKDKNIIITDRQIAHLREVVSRVQRQIKLHKSGNLKSADKKERLEIAVECCQEIDKVLCEL